MTSTVKPLDRRLLAAGLTVTVAELVEILTDHWPHGRPVSESWSVCPGCGHEYTDQAPECPTAAAVRPMLYRRRNEARPGTVPWPRDDLARPAGRGSGPARRRGSAVDRPSLEWLSSRMATGTPAPAPRTPGSPGDGEDAPALFDLPGGGGRG